MIATAIIAWSGGSRLPVTSRPEVAHAAADCPHGAAHDNTSGSSTAGGRIRDATFAAIGHHPGDYSAFPKDPKAGTWSYAVINLIIYAAGLGLVALGRKLGANCRNRQRCVG